MAPHPLCASHYRVKLSICGGGTQLSLDMFLLLTNNIIMFPEPAADVYLEQHSLIECGVHCTIFKQNGKNLTIAINVNMGTTSPVCSCHTHLLIMRSVDFWDASIHKMDSGSSPVSFYFLQPNSARLQLSPDRPKVFDTTACPYLTWARTLCVCTIYTIPH